MIVPPLDVVERPPHLAVAHPSVWLELHAGGSVVVFIGHITTLVPVAGQVRMADGVVHVVSQKAMIRLLRIVGYEVRGE